MQLVSRIEKNEPMTNSFHSALQMAGPLYFVLVVKEGPPQVDARLEQAGPQNDRMQAVSNRKSNKRNIRMAAASSSRIPNTI